MARNNEMEIRGKTSFAKVIGDPVMNKFTNEREWSVDLEIDKATESQLKKAGLGDKVKRKDTYLEGRPYVSFRHKEKRLDKSTGEVRDNFPIKIVDIVDRPWDQRLIGNGSVVDVKFAIGGTAPRIGLYIRSIRVLDLVSYEKKDFSPITEDDEYFAKAAEAMNAASEGGLNKFKKEVFDDLDDDLPYS
jgi:hypothetical protein